MSIQDHFLKTMCACFFTAMCIFVLSCTEQKKDGESLKIDAIITQDASADVSTDVAVGEATQDKTVQDQSSEKN